MIDMIEGRTYRYWSHGVVELICKADEDMISENDAWMKKYGTAPYNIGEDGWCIIAMMKMDRATWESKDRNTILRMWVDDLAEHMTHTANSIGTAGISEVMIYNTDWSKVKECGDLNNMRDEDVMACLFEYWTEMMRDFELERGEYC